MKQLSVESSKGINSGFVIYEAELRRTVQTISEELKKAIPEIEPTFKFLLRFANGVVAETDDIENILKQENSGTGRIITVKIEASTGDSDNEHKIVVLFRNTNKDKEFDSIPIKFKIIGKSRDWVFIASSTIEERLNKIKRKIFDPSMNRKTYMIMMFSLFPIMMLILATISSTVPDNSNKSVNELEQKWKKGEIKDAVEALIYLEKAKHPSTSKVTTYKPVFIICGCMLILILIYFFVLRYYPIFNFCWGDYLNVFEKIEGQRRIIIWVIILGLIISIGGGIIANTIGGIKIF